MRLCSAVLFFVAIGTVLFLLPPSLEFIRERAVARKASGLSYWWSTAEYPTRLVWNKIHKEYNPGDVGGRWGYSFDAERKTGVQQYISNNYSEVDTILDVACNLGYTLAVLHERFPTTKLFGTDISDIVLKKAADNCPSCHFAQFDLARLVNQKMNHRKRIKIPGIRLRRFDIVIVSGILYYLAWGGFTPADFEREGRELWSHVAVREAQANFFRNLQAMAVKEVIVGHHGDNERMLDILYHSNATHDKRHNVYIFKGTAQ
eukprot:NODE_1455_length_905_cov_250.059579_g1125_i0.p1 GENE.NODE_1455_length_905_cov_250.059579_g1125_i0~~NODE_1455_length_905_cov_250.059579_g1125_i0.p1  ORF type:complete len:281 (-),score=68.13 NODE_1455_length_905_cov_250.059579_g1125_i0:62-844(-)